MGPIEIIGFVMTIIGGLAVVPASYRFVRGKYFSKLTLRDAEKCVVGILEEIERDGWSPELVIGLGRSGAMWGGWLAGNLGSLPIVVIDRKFERTATGRLLRLIDAGPTLTGIKKRYPGRTRVLAVEGATTSGAAFALLGECALKAFPDLEIRTVALWTRRGTTQQPHYTSSRDLDPWPDRLPWHFRPAFKRFLHANQP